jgi:hypothetical protein
MTYEPVHTLSECLLRRHRSLTKHIRKLRENPANRGSDELVACCEEVCSIEYWLKIAEGVERNIRIGTELEEMAWFSIDMVQEAL